MPLAIQDSVTPVMASSFLVDPWNTISGTGTGFENVIVNNRLMACGAVADQDAAILGDLVYGNFDSD